MGVQRTVNVVDSGSNQLGILSITAGLKSAMAKNYYYESTLDFRESSYRLEAKIAYEQKQNALKNAAAKAILGKRNTQSSVGKTLYFEITDAQRGLYLAQGDFGGSDFVVTNGDESEIYAQVSKGVQGAYIDISDEEKSYDLLIVAYAVFLAGKDYSKNLSDVLLNN